MELLKQNAEKQGYLKVILGPMFSGKTTELIRIYVLLPKFTLSIITKLLTVTKYLNF